MSTQEYDVDAAYRSADRALDALDRMTYTGDGVGQAQTYLEQAIDADSPDAVYDGLQHAYRLLTREEDELHDAQLDTPWDALHLRGAVVALEGELPDRLTE